MTTSFFTTLKSIKTAYQVGFGFIRLNDNMLLLVKALWLHTDPGPDNEDNLKANRKRGIKKIENNTKEKRERGIRNKTEHDKNKIIVNRVGP